MPGPFLEKQNYLVSEDTITHAKLSDKLQEMLRFNGKSDNNYYNTEFVKHDTDLTEVLNEIVTDENVCLIVPSYEESLSDDLCNFGDETQYKHHNNTLFKKWLVKKYYFRVFTLDGSNVTEARTEQSIIPLLRRDISLLNLNDKINSGMNFKLLMAKEFHNQNEHVNNVSLLATFLDNEDNPIDGKLTVFVDNEVRGVIDTKNSNNHYMGLVGIGHNGYKMDSHDIPSTLRILSDTQPKVELGSDGSTKILEPEVSFKLDSNSKSYSLDKDTLEMKIENNLKHKLYDFDNSRYAFKKDLGISFPSKRVSSRMKIVNKIQSNDFKDSLRDVLGKHALNDVSFNTYTNCPYPISEIDHSKTSTNLWTSISNGVALGGASVSSKHFNHTMVDAHSLGFGRGYWNSREALNSNSIANVISKKENRDNLPDLFKKSVSSRNNRPEYNNIYTGINTWEDFVGTNKDGNLITPIPEPSEFNPLDAAFSGPNLTDDEIKEYVRSTVANKGYEGLLSHYLENDEMFTHFKVNYLNTSALNKDYSDEINVIKHHIKGVYGNNTPNAHPYSKPDFISNLSQGDVVLQQVQNLQGSGTFNLAIDGSREALKLIENGSNHSLEYLETLRICNLLNNVKNSNGLDHIDEFGELEWVDSSSGQEDLNHPYHPLNQKQLTPSFSNSLNNEWFNDEIKQNIKEYVTPDFIEHEISDNYYFKIYYNDIENKENGVVFEAVCKPGNNIPLEFEPRMTLGIIRTTLPQNWKGNLTIKYSNPLNLTKDVSRKAYHSKLLANGLTEETLTNMSDQEFEALMTQFNLPKINIANIQELPINFHNYRGILEFVLRGMFLQQLGEETIVSILNDILPLDHIHRLSLHEMGKKVDKDHGLPSSFSIKNFINVICEEKVIELTNLKMKATMDFNIGSEPGRDLDFVNETRYHDCLSGNTDNLQTDIQNNSHILIALSHYKNENNLSGKTNLELYKIILEECIGNVQKTFAYQNEEVPTLGSFIVHTLSDFWNWHPTQLHGQNAPKLGMSTAQVNLPFFYNIIDLTTRSIPISKVTTKVITKNDIPNLGVVKSVNQVFDGDYVFGSFTTLAQLEDEDGNIFDVKSPIFGNLEFGVNTNVDSINAGDSIAEISQSLYEAAITGKNVANTFYNKSYDLAVSKNGYYPLYENIVDAEQHIGGDGTYTSFTPADGFDNTYYMPNGLDSETNKNSGKAYMGNHNMDTDGKPFSFYTMLDSNVSRVPFWLDLEDMTSPNDLTDNSSYTTFLDCDRLNITPTLTNGVPDGKRVNGAIIMGQFLQNGLSMDDIKNMFDITENDIGISKIDDMARVLNYKFNVLESRTFEFPFVDVENSDNKYSHVDDIPTSIQPLVFKLLSNTITQTISLRPGWQWVSLIGDLPEEDNNFKYLSPKPLYDANMSPEEIPQNSSLGQLLSQVESQNLGSIIEWYTDESVIYFGQNPFINGNHKYKWNKEHRVNNSSNLGFAVKVNLPDGSAPIDVEVELKVKESFEITINNGWNQLGLPITPKMINNNSDKFVNNKISIKNYFGEGEDAENSGIRNGDKVYSSNGGVATYHSLSSGHPFYSGKWENGSVELESGKGLEVERSNSESTNVLPHFFM